jgi:hypothetical protein
MNNQKHIISLARSYTNRNDILSDLGYSNYLEYLSSDLWKHTSKSFLIINPNCCICLTKANQVHHTKYTTENLLGISYDGLVPICYKCHYKCEFTKDKVKRSLQEANNRMSQLIKRRSNVEKSPHKFVKCSLCHEIRRITKRCRKCRKKV